MSTIFLCPLEVYDSTGQTPAMLWEGHNLSYDPSEEEQQLSDRQSRGERLSIKERDRLRKLITERMPKKYYSLQERRKKRFGEQGYLIDTILPEGTVHLIGGPSGIGKSTWLLQTIHQWEQGLPVMGFPSHPMPYVYFMCDRSEVDLQATLKQIGLSDWDVKAYAIESLGREPFYLEPQDVKIEHLPKIFPWAKIFFIEGIHWFYEKKQASRSGDYVDTLRFWSYVRDQFCENYLTIIGTTHIPKMKINEGYARTRDKIFGSVAGPAVAGTIIVMDGDPKSPGKIEMTICPRNSKEFKVKYCRTDDGALALVASDDKAQDDGAFSLFDKKLDELEIESTIASSIIRKWKQEFDVSKATTYRWLEARIFEGRLERLRPGLFQIKKVRIN
jgi:hypothetical protein